jgi:hypothetical protein
LYLVQGITMEGVPNSLVVSFSCHPEMGKDLPVAEFA